MVQKSGKSGVQVISTLCRYRKLERWNANACVPFEGPISIANWFHYYLLYTECTVKLGRVQSTLYKVEGKTSVLISFLIYSVMESSLL
jgi:hypothetical protein